MCESYIISFDLYSIMRFHIGETISTIYFNWILNGS